MRSPAARLAVVVLLVVWTVGTLGVVPGTATAATESGVLIEVAVHENGDAVWTVTARYRLETENETQAFDRVIDDFLAGEAVGPSIATFRVLAARGENRTGRSMQIDAVNRTGEIHNRSAAGPETPGEAVGVLTLQFRWTGFASTTDEQIQLGDVFGGAWDLAADQTLVIRPPTDYSVDTVRPSTAVEGGVLRWEGPQDFSENEPAVVYLPSEGTIRIDEDRDLLTLVGYAVGVGLALVGGGLAVYAWLRRDELFGPHGAWPFGGVSTPESAGDDTTDTDHVDEGGERGGHTGAEGSDSDEDGIDPDLLSDEERIEHLLDRNGGRMKQADIVSETDWSNAKVSQLLSTMADEGRVEKLRIGRENLITLAEETDTGTEE